MVFTADTEDMAEETGTSEMVTEAKSKMVETGALMEVKGTISTQHAPNMEISISASISPATVEEGWDKSGTMDDHGG